MSVSESLAEINSKLDKLIVSHNNFALLVKKHETELYGEGDVHGLRTKLYGIAKRLDWIQGSALLIWSVIFGIIQAAIAVLPEWFRRKVGQ
jgi:hypothetical protein